MIRKRTILPVVLLAVIMIPALSVLCIEEAEASTDYLVMETNTLSTGDFNSRNTSDIKITISNGTEDEVTVDVWVTYQDATDQSIEGALGRDNIKIDPEDKGTAVISIGFGSEGDKLLRIHAKSDDVDFISIGNVEGVASYNFSIYVHQSIWSNTITYVAIILIIVVVAVAIYLRQRSAPKAEPQMTFTELEEMRRSQRTGVEPSGSAARRSSRPSAERRRYEGNKRRRR